MVLYQDSRYHSWKARDALPLLASKLTLIPRKSEHAVRFNQRCYLVHAYKPTSDNSQHSHEIGAANLPFTRRGRKAAAEAEKTKSNKHIRFANDDSSANNTSSPPPIAGPSSVPQSTPPSNYSSSVSMIAPLPSGQTSYQATPQTYNFQPPYQYAPAPAPVPTPVPPPVHPPPTQHTSDAFSADRWQNMETLFQSVRENARSFAYPTASVAVLETVLIRLFLEGPQPVMSQQPMAVSSMSQSMSARMENEDGSSDE